MDLKRVVFLFVVYSACTCSVDERYDFYAPYVPNWKIAVFVDILTMGFE